MIMTLVPSTAFGKGDRESTSDTQYFYDKVYKAGKDDGYGKKEFIKEKDVHYGWKLGSFVISGYTRQTKDEKGNIVFLKNVGDKIKLGFQLKQDIDKLNDDETLSIGIDKKGYDHGLETERTNFGRGAVLIRKTDYQNKVEEPKIYVNYLEANAKTDANTKVDVLEEGDYEAVLDYRVKKDPHQIFGKSIFPSKSDYRISFKFSVRNGNCMVYPFDAKTKAELTNTAVAENGFYLDTAKSRYLTLDIKREVMNKGKDGLVEDTRFNKPAKDGEKFTDEGIYTITAKNQYTNTQTIKKIYVGDNEVLKAYVATNYSVEEINALKADGAKFDKQGNIDVSATKGNLSNQDGNGKKQSKLPLIVVVVLLALAVILGVGYGKRKKVKPEKRIEDEGVHSDIEDEEQCK